MAITTKLIIEQLRKTLTNLVLIEEIFLKSLMLHIYKNVVVHNKFNIIMLIGFICKYSLIVNIFLSNVLTFF